MRERDRIDWARVSSLGMLGEKEWEEEWNDREGRESERDYEWHPTMSICFIF
jgi:hypothetical protein